MIEIAFSESAETLYDYILREIEAAAEEFHEAMIIGRVLGRYQPGIADTLVAFRIEKCSFPGNWRLLLRGPKIGQAIIGY